MRVMRYLVLTPFIVLLSACDPEVKPAKVEPPKSAAPAEQQAPAPAPEPPVVVQPQAARQQPEPAPQPQLARASNEAPKPAVASQAKASQESAKAVRAHAPKVELDLSLPPELLEQANAQGSSGEAAAPLLPPLFEEKATASDPLQLSGRLITNEADADYWKSVEGAELQFEIKR